MNSNSEKPRSIEAYSTAFVRSSDWLERFPLVAVDVGNNRIKFGYFESFAGDLLPEPAKEFAAAGTPEALGTVVGQIRALPPVRGWWIATVNRPASTELIDLLRNERRGERIILLTASDLPLKVTVPRPDMVGIDRLVDALAANRLRRPATAAVLVDIGSAITVDLISPEGAFEGGAILPGFQLLAWALHHFTDMLPAIDVTSLQYPPVIGTNTVAAMEAGVFWGAVGGIRELITRMTSQFGGEVDVFLTGGGSPRIAELLAPFKVSNVPHLTLAGIVLGAMVAPI